MITFTGLRSASVKTKYLTHLRELVEAEKLKPVIDRTYSIKQIAEAHRYVETGHKKGAVIIIMEQ